MANDYEARAKAADELTGPNSGEAIKGNTDQKDRNGINEAG